MGLRYLIAVAREGQRHPAELDGTLERLGLQRVASDHDWCLYLSTPDRWARFGDGRGIIVGDVFDRSDASGAAETIGGGRSAQVEDMQALVRAYWGGYVALRPGVGAFEVLRDPSGALSAYHVRGTHAWYFASDAPLLVEAGLYVPEIDWNEVAWFYYTNGLPGERTALAGLDQLIPGVATTVSAASTDSRLIWSPWDHIRAKDGGAKTLRETTIRCVRAWQANYGAVVVGVSGGLDSSIVACSLDPRSTVEGLTISTGDALGDEAPQATALCRALGLPLSAGHYTAAAVDIDRPGLAHRPMPGGMAQLQSYDAVVIETIARLGATAFMSGVGGDNVFHMSRSARALVDRLLTLGPTPGLVVTLRDICRITGASPRAVIREALRVPRGPGSKYKWFIDTRLLDPTMVASLADRPRVHPWLNPPADSLPGKSAHVAMIVRAHAYLECHDRRWPFASVHPLMSQPILELALATPSWAACEGGVDRARARRAFLGDLPDSILQRRLKGGPDGFALKILRTQLPAIRERLLDGVLVRQNIVDRRALEQALNERDLMRGQDYTRILQFLDTEAWSQHWLSTSPAFNGQAGASPPSVALPRGGAGPPATDHKARP